MTDVYRVRRRNQKVELSALGLRCDDTEVPHPLSGQSDDFFVGVTEVDNRRTIVDEDGNKVADERELLGLFAASIFRGTLAVIVAMQSEREPSYWLSIPLAGAKVEAVGQSGLFKKRPAIVKVTTSDLVVKLGEPARLYPSSRRIQARRSQELFDLLRAAAANGPRSESGAGS